jgi:hypothetical protein
VAELEERLLAKGHSTDRATLLRTVRFANGNVSKAVDVYEAFAKWYNTANVAALKDTPFDPEKAAVLEACYFQYLYPGHCKRGCPIKVLATGRWATSRMKACGVTEDDFIRWHTLGMEAHRFLLTIDQASVGAPFVRDASTGALMAVPLHPERGVLVICDIRGCSLSAFYDGLSLIGKMIGVDKTNYYDSMDRMLIVNAPFALTHVAWPIISPMLSSDVTDKVKVVSGDATEGLLKYIDEDQLPLEFRKGQPPKPSVWPIKGVPTATAAARGAAAKPAPSMSRDRHTSASSAARPPSSPRKSSDRPGSVDAFATEASVEPTWEVWSADMFDSYEPRRAAFEGPTAEADARADYDEKWSSTRILVEATRRPQAALPPPADAADAGAGPASSREAPFWPSDVREVATDGVNVFALDSIRAAIHAEHSEPSVAGSEGGLGADLVNGVDALSTGLSNQVDSVAEGLKDVMNFMNPIPSDTKPSFLPSFFGEESTEDN